MQVQDQPGYVPTPEEEELPAQYHRQMVFYRTNEAPGTIVVDTPSRFLYLVQGNSRAIRYGIGVGRDGFQWSGSVEHLPQGGMAGLDPAAGNDRSASPICRASWPAARAIRWARAHFILAAQSTGCTAPTSRRPSAQSVSSGCFRLVNGDIIDLYDRVPVGTKVVVRQQPTL